MSKNIGILLLNLGGPDSLKSVKPFLFNLFSDPDIFDIFRLPFFWWTQKPIAWLISTFRLKNTQLAYRLIGGRSPILPLTEAQGNAMIQQLQEQYGIEAKCYIAMRYWHPLTEEAVGQIITDGIEELILLPMYPQYSLTTTGSSVNELKRALTERQVNIPLKLVNHYYDDPRYQKALGQTVREALAENCWSCASEQVLILFSAHSLPKRFVEKTGDIYPRQIIETARQLMEEQFPDNPWDLCYQSKIGKIPWLEPYTDDALKNFAEKGIQNILLVPLSFVSEHVETLYEIDLLYLPLAEKLGIAHCHRSKALNTSPLFIDALTALVKEKIEEPVGLSR